MEYSEYNDMVQFSGHDKTTQCVVYDQTPDSEQKKINIVVRPAYTVGKVISDIKTQYHYDKFELLMQPISGGDLVYLNDHQNQLLYKVNGFEPQTKNVLVILPFGKWDGNTKKRYEFPAKSSLKLIMNGTSSSNSSSSTAKNVNTTATTVIATPPPPPPLPPVNFLSNNKKTTTTTITTTTAGSLGNNNIATCVKAMNGRPLTNSQYHQSQNLTNSNSYHGPLNEEALGSTNTLSPPSSMTTVTNATNTDSLNLSPMSDPDPLSDDDLALGASASPTETEPMQCGGPLSLTHNSSSKIALHFASDTNSGFHDKSDGDIDGPKKYPLSPLPAPTAAIMAAPTNNGYVGLVNQAMTCYLNSLLQALYMTPEFRNALYRWEFDNDNEAKNIPYQLQKLFLNLQTSKKSAVETTDLTRSFGWNSSEAWQQHDIQELCRVMFDALEHKFKNTKQANLISNLYEGKMIDYVKCLECNTEKTRADTFLDIPLPVRPFGSQAAYGSIEEALRAFVQPETLDGNNQYFCEKCNKKCDAHKGLKFKNFPYVLTLHLKRFDFDYTTMHRIKLNDKVTFPQTLNLNTFVKKSESTTANGNSVAPTDDCSTTDSGSAMEEDNWSSGVGTTASSTTQNDTDVNDEEQDEGIDLSSSTDHRNRVNSEQNLKQDLGPYTYELFAIMIHSGSASGGHYYAYIKEFDNNEWYCFNDQTVTPITQEDIQKSFGGGSSKTYYSSVYSSSTNAYMLMYRQIDTKRNEKCVKADDFPEHIKTLTEKLKEEEETRVSRGSVRHRPITDLALPEQIKPRVYFYNPKMKKLIMTRVYVSQKFDINVVLESAYQMLSVEQFAPLSHCRLVGYDPPAERIIRSFEGLKDPTLEEIQGNSEDPVEFLLEYRADGQEFEVYEPGGSTWYVYMVNLSTMEMDGPFFVHSKTFENNDTLRHSIAVRLHVKEDQLLVATLRNGNAFVAYDPMPTKEAQQQLQEMARSRFKDLTYLYLFVPNTDPTNLEIIGIPANETHEPIIPAVQEPTVGSSTSVAHNGLTNGLNESNAATLTVAHESNSEDSSLSDGDRTLVENIQHRGDGDSQISSTSHSPQLSSPEEENRQDSINRINAFYNGYSHGEPDLSPIVPQAPQFFHAIKLESVDTKATISSRHHYMDPDSSEEAARKPVVSYKILVDSHMKLSTFKSHVQRLIQVPDNYFQLNRKHDKCLKNMMSETLVYFSEGESLFVELGKELQPEEHKAKIFFMRLSELNNESGRLPCVCEWIYTDSMTVATAKANLVAKLQRIDLAKYKSLNVQNCRLWLKGGRSPIKIFTDDETLGSDIRSSAAMEFIVQECEDGAIASPDENSLTIFVRRWHPDSLQLDKFQEITLHKNSEMRNAISQISGIPEDNVAYTKVNGYFPYTNVSLLTINSAMTWFTVPSTMDKYPLSSAVSGNLFFYKDDTAELKELTTEERREMSNKEKTRLDRLGCTSSSRFSPRRERALKIYVDSPATTASPPVDANSSMADD
ncbi:ubiquitin carboxyl-terminal hydrolase 47 isoform X1 [Lucilia cuprina]|uniref:ubiquitin carboxyl-terminal hydrolase 47 isoform X1 n=2 Tax=Lucilia cuprina TaxID=7375 RepID=UPI001F05D1E7|nr:ubiquitin carboxyl-terminal hydrolase 47 isoform X1 [Lucilia cuprina]